MSDEPTNPETAPKRQHQPTSMPSGPSVNNPRPRGGRRPGAGAPKGNLNGLKHGLYSKQMAALGVAFSTHPRLQEGLLALAKRQQKKHRKAEIVAAQIFTNIIKRGGLQPTNEWQARELKDFQDAFDRN